MFQHLLSRCVNGRGAKVAGRREWAWTCQQLGISRFPWDFPDCQAAAELAQLLGAEHVRSLHLLPNLYVVLLILCCKSLFPRVVMAQRMVSVPFVIG